ncbi:MAG: DUF1573 domain-containing protein [Isosphaeraceae bacterium]
MYEFDLGPVISNREQHRHEFTVTNPGSRPVRLLSGLPLTPCCSAMGPLPTVIPPGGRARIPVVFSARHQSGRKQFTFLVGTDAGPAPISLVLSADLVSAWDLQGPVDSGLACRVNRPQEWSLRLVCRRDGAEGLGPPESVAASTPLSAEFVGPPRVIRAAGRMVEVFRNVRLKAPSCDSPGWRRGEITFFWPDGGREEAPVSWAVTPAITVSPTGLVLQPSRGPLGATVRLRSDDLPFRVLKVLSPLLKTPFKVPTGPKRKTHRLEIALDPAETHSAGSSDLTIITDHPDQSRVVVSVVVPPAKRGSGL